MSEAFPTEYDDTFWQIVHDNRLFETVVVPVASEDETVVRILDWLVTNRIDDEKILGDYYDSLEKHLVSTYGLPSELSDLVFSMCEDNLQREEF